jgi:hypothetical protein
MSPTGKKRKTSTPIDIDFTLRRVFDKKGFRYASDALLATSAHPVLADPFRGKSSPL